MPKINVVTVDRKGVGKCVVNEDDVNDETDKILDEAPDYGDNSTDEAPVDTNEDDDADEDESFSEEELREQLEHMSDDQVRDMLKEKHGFSAPANMKRESMDNKLIEFETSEDE